MGIVITTDSTCDLSKELIEKYDIKVLPLCVMLGSDEHLDGVDVTQTEIFEYVKKTKILPKTAARSIEDFKDFFKPFLDAGNEVIHIGISSGLSSCYNNALRAKEELKSNNLHIVDGRTLSTGTALLLIHAVELARSGKSAEEIVKIETERAYHHQTSFVVDTLDYLHKGGRCSTMQLFGANLLGIKPRLQVVDSKLISNGKYRGKMLPVLKKYIDETLEKFNTPDTTRCFLSHTITDQAFLTEIVEYVKAKKIFKEVIAYPAGCTITSHCGPGTLGIIYLNDGGNK